MLQTTVKISNITNLSDARYCAGMGVEMLGFSMDSLPVERFTEIRNWVAGVQIVGETIATDIVVIMELVAKFQPDYLQINDWKIVSEVSKLGLPILLAVDFQDPNLSFILSSSSNLVKYFLIENSDEFTHLDIETLNQLAPVANEYPILLAFGVQESNIKEILEEKFVGIALQGSDEVRPGFKDFDEMMNILEALEDNS